MTGKLNYFQGIALATFALPWAAEAHPFHWATESIGFVSGLLHPLTSLEHVVTLFAVGLCLFRGGRRIAFPMSLFFAALMLIGVGLAQLPIEIAHLDAWMALSVLLLMLALILGEKLPVYLSVPLVAGLAVAHGYQHAYDIWLDSGALAYTEGFTLATWVLLAIGMGVGRLLKWCQVKYSLDDFAERLSCLGFYRKPIK